MKQNAIIIGDSYSTFAGFVPEGYAIWYPTNYEDDTAVRDVSQTWWHQVMEEANLNLALITAGPALPSATPDIIIGMLLKAPPLFTG